MKVRLLAAAGIAAGLIAGSAGLASATSSGGDGLIAFVKGEQIFTISPAGGTPTKLTTANKNDAPRWSPDGTRIAYVHETVGGGRQVWTMNANGTAKKAVTTTAVGFTMTEPAWSSDGTMLYFGVTAKKGNVAAAQLERVKSTTPYGAPVKIGTIKVSTYLAMSGDGHTLIYRTTAGGTATYDTSTSEFTPMLAGATIDQAASADGASYTYTVGTGPTAATSVCQFGGGCVSGVAGDQAVAFAPAGDALVLMTPVANADPRLWVTDPAFGARRFLTGGYMPDWQPTH